MKQSWIFPLIITFILAGISPLLGQGIVLQKDIFIGSDQVKNSVFSLGGTITVQGKVNKSVVAFGGTIIIEGEVGEDILAFGSKIKIMPTASIKGDVICLGGVLHKEDNINIEGDTIYFELKNSEDVKKFLNEGLGGMFGMSFLPLFIILKLISFIIWFILTLFVAGVFPKQLIYASSQIKSRFWLISGTGFFSLIIFAFLTITATFLSLLLIGIPLLIALFILGIVIKIFGRVILFYFFGDIVSNALGQKKFSPLVTALIGFLLVSLIGFVPIAGWFIGVALNIIGWGAVLLTKFGSRENWFRKT